MGSQSVTTGSDRPTRATTEATDWVVLGLVAEGAKHGFAIARELGPSTALGRVWTVSRPLVYRSLVRLASRGWIRARGSEPGGRGPAREVYEITAIGAARLGAWLGEPVQHLREVRSLLLLKLFFLMRQGRSADDLARKQGEVLQSLRTRLARQAAQAAGFERLLLLWRLNFAEAVEHLLEAAGGRTPDQDRPWQNSTP